MVMTVKTLTVVCPAFNEEAVIERFYQALKEQLDSITQYQSSIVFVVDGGADRTFDILTDIARRDKRVRALKFSRNFGHQMALIAGIDHAEGDVVIMMDSDLQHPPSLIPRLIEEHEQGRDIVYTVREGERIGFMRKIAGGAFYRLVNLISEVPIHANASDFRLISRKVADTLRDNIHERDLFLRGMMQWIGFNHASVPFTPAARGGGISKYSLGRLLRFAVSGAVSFSRKPLRAAGILGLLFAVFGFLFALYSVFEYFTSNSLPPGWSTLVVLLSLFGGIQLIVLWILGEYIGVIFEEVKARPRYIVAESVNITSSKA
jgi:dolichol-phosphate mannosyltransferase